MLLLFSVVGIAQGTMLGLTLVTRRSGRRPGSVLLGALLLLLALDMSYGVLAYTGRLLMLPHLVRVQTPVPFLYGPLLWWAVRALLEPVPGRAKGDVLHLLPFVACVLTLLPLYVQPAPTKVAYLNSLYDALPWESYVIGGLRRLHQLAYLVASYRMLRRGLVSSSRIGREHHRIGVLLGAFALVWAVGMVRYAWAFTFMAGIADVVVVSAFMVAAGFVALRPSHAWSGHPATDRGRRSVPGGLGAEASLSVQERLEHLMATEAPYRTTDLTLPDLAERVGVTPQALSYVLNEHVGLNFNAYVNRFRVAAVQQGICDPSRRHLTLAAIAEEAGFNSTSTFNAAFKKTTGMTPTAYRKQQAIVPK